MSLGSRIRLLRMSRKTRRVAAATREGAGVDEACRHARLEQFAIPFAVSGARQGAGVAAGNDGRGCFLYFLKACQ
jgi:hypothetical protein